MSNLTKFVMAVIGLVAMLLITSRQLFLYVVADPSGLSIFGGNSHLWLAAIAVVIACVAVGLMFVFFGRHETNKWPQERHNS